jgi:hypothetical protein
MPTRSHVKFQLRRHWFNEFAAHAMQRWQRQVLERTDSTHRGSFLCRVTTQR